MAVSGNQEKISNKAPFVILLLIAGCVGVVGYYTLKDLDLGSGGSGGGEEAPVLEEPALNEPNSPFDIPEQTGAQTPPPPPATADEPLPPPPIPTPVEESEPPLEIPEI